MPQETPQLIAGLHQVTAELVLEGRFQLAQYPHRHLAVVARRGNWYDRLATALTAADLLASVQFELVNIVQFDQGPAVCAILRRR